MIDRKTRLRLRRSVRKSKRQVEGMSVQAEEQLERHFIRRLHRLVQVRRFVAGWVLFIVLLISLTVVQLRALSPYYQKVAPAAGGTYTEGLIGSFTNANPLYATGGVDGAVSRLLFSSLFKYDQEGMLASDLAESWSVDDTGKKYTVVLRDDAVWHDGTDLTVEDIVFTYKTIQNPDAQSPLFSSWKDVKVSANEERKLIFTLPNVLASFPYSLTNGIVPKHVLEDVPASQLRSDRFNTVMPVGSGPFAWETIEVRGETPELRQEQIALLPNETYHLGAPGLQRFVLKTFRTEEVMLNNFKDKQLNAMSGLSSLDDTLEEDVSLSEYSMPLTGSVMIFFKTTEGVLQNKEVRKALVSAANVKQIVNSLPYFTVPTDSPLLSGQLGYNEAITQLPFDIKTANKLLDDAGWKRGEDGIRVKEEQKLAFTLKAPSTSELTSVTQQLRDMWREIGVHVDVDQPSDSELQTLISLHQYEAVAYSISVGQDPDVFAFWHSSQADVRSANRLNLSEYQSEDADQALEAGRTRTDPILRDVKYEPFLKAWQQDAPALALYQPRYLYVVRGRLHGLENKQVNSAVDRYSNVHNWMVRTDKVYRH